MKSATSWRLGVTESGAMLMSASPVAKIGTLVSWLTATTSSGTPRRLANSSASTQAGPEYCGPLPVVFSGSQGNSPMAATRRAPRSLIAAIVGLEAESGTSVEAASAAGPPARQASAPPIKTVRRTELIGMSDPRLRRACCGRW